MAQVTESLTAYPEGSNRVGPGLATQWQRNEDGTKWTFSIVSGRVFNDGSPVDATAICANFDYWNELNEKRGKSDDNRTVCTAKDDQVEVVYKSPRLSMADYLAFPSWGIQAPSSLKEGMAPIGSGPYAIQSYSDHEIRLIPVKAMARNAGLIFRAVASEPKGALLDGFTNGSFDIAPSDKIKIVDRSRLRFAGGNGSVTYLEINARTGSPLGELAVRRGLAQAIDRNELPRGIGQEPTLLLAPETQLTSSHGPMPPFDPGAASAVFQNRGLNLVFGVYANDSDGMEIARVLARQFDSVGVGVTIKELGNDGVDKGAREGSVDLLLWRGTSNGYDGYWWVTLLISNDRTGGQGDQFEHQNAAEVKELLNRSYYESDAVREKTIGEAMELVAARLRTVPLLAEPRSVLVQDNIQGVNIDNRGVVTLANATSS